MITANEIEREIFTQINLLRRAPWTFIDELDIYGQQVLIGGGTVTQEMKQAYG
jgi:hypothetical protein